MHSDRVQDLTTVLYLSSEERREWRRDPGTVARCYGLDDAGREMVLGMGDGELEFYAKQLQAKRFSEIMKFAPPVAPDDRQVLWEVFQCYADRYVPVGPKKHVGDAIAFAEFLCEGKEGISSEMVSRFRFELAPWDLNFRLERELFVLRVSGVALQLVRACRVSGLRCQVKRFTDRVGIFVKPPFLSLHLEWYLPCWPLEAYP